jgi:hypothetical protein
MQQIADWLEKLGMSEYTVRFAENDIDFTILGDLTDQDLEKIGVASLGHRRKLLRAIADLKDAKKSEPGIAVAAAAPAAPHPQDTAERRQVIPTIAARFAFAHRSLPACQLTRANAASCCSILTF